MLYEIIIRGYIGDSWFDELNVTRQADSMTTLRGRLIDQAALQGVLRRISDLGMELISVNSIPETDEPRGDEI
jgi:hypothetical protein